MIGQSKLECLLLVSFFQANLSFEAMIRGYANVVRCKMFPPDLTMSFSYKCQTNLNIMSVTNTLAYFV